MKYTLILLFTVLTFVMSTTAQTPTPVVYKSYAEALADGKKWLSENNQYKAEPAFRRAVELSSTDAQKLDAMLAHAAVLRRVGHITADYTSKSKYSKTRAYRTDEAYAIYQQVLKIPGLTQAQIDEVKLAVADTVATCFTEYNGCPQALEKKVEADTTMKPDRFLRSEYTKLIDSATPDVRILAHIGRAATHDTAMLFGQIKRDEVTAAFNDLKAATEVAAGKDEHKAKAFFEIVELANRIKDYNTVAGAYERVTLLPAATIEQKIKAYDGLVSILMANNMIKASRDQLAAAHKLAGLTNPHKTKLYRLGALATMMDVDPSDATAMAKQKKAAIAELDKTAAFPKMTDEDKLKTYVANAEYFQNNPRAYTLALDHLEKALKLKKLDERAKAEAQYQIGETYRIQKDYARAREAYLAVPEANPQYRNYAAQRMKQMDAEIAGSKP